MTISPGFTSRPTFWERIFSASVMGIKGPAIRRSEKNAPSGEGKIINVS
jgi:hypothetical protein